MDPPTLVPIESLVEHHAWVRSLARALVSDESMADDVAQDAWLFALRHPPRHGSALRAWLARLVRHRAFDRHRADRRRERREVATWRGESAPDSPADAVARVEEQQIAVSEVLALAEPYRSTIVLRFFEGLTLPAIAARVDAPVETVRTRLRRALDLLRRRLDARHAGDRSAWRAALVPLAGLGRDSRGGNGSWLATVKAGVPAVAGVGGAVMAQKVLLAVAATVVVGVVGGGAFLVVSASPSDTGPRIGAHAGTGGGEGPGAPHKLPTIEARLERAEQTAERAIREVEELRERVRSFESAGAGGISRPPPDQGAWKDEVLRRFKSVDGNEQPVVLAATMRDLATIGDAAVPDLVAMLRSGEDADWGGGPGAGVSTNGTSVSAYGRKRTAVIDALRQIGTPEAKAALVSAVADSGSLTDLRDLLLLYRRSGDPTVVAAISDLVPGALRQMSERGLDASERTATGICTWLNWWVQDRRLDSVARPLRNLLARADPQDHRYRGFLASLVEIAPDDAASVVAERLASEGDDGPSLLTVRFGPGGASPTLAGVARYVDALLERAQLTPADRRALFNGVANLGLCTRIADPRQRAADGRALLSVLEAGRLTADFDETWSRHIVQPAITRLREQIDKAEKQ